MLYFCQDFPSKVTVKCSVWIWNVWFCREFKALSNAIRKKFLGIFRLFLVDHFSSAGASNAWSHYFQSFSVTEKAWEKINIWKDSPFNALQNPYQTITNIKNFLKRRHPFSILKVAVRLWNKHRSTQVFMSNTILMSDFIYRVLLDHK